MAASLPCPNFFPPWLEAWLDSACESLSDDQALYEAVNRLHGFYRSADSPPQSRTVEYSQLEVEAYTRFFMPTNMIKVWAIIQRTPSLLQDLMAKDRVRIIDLGCGPGTAIWALIFYAAKHCPQLLEKLSQVIFVDTSPRFLDLGMKLCRELQCHIPAMAHVTWTTCNDSWQHHIRNEADLLIMSNLLREAAAELPPLSTIPARFIFIVEPGTKEAFQGVRRLRNRIAETRDHKVLFPCPACDQPCPMDQDNWCHFAINRFTHPYLQRIAARLKRHSHKHYYSALVLRKERICAASLPSRENWRLLSACRKQNRSAIRWLCNGVVCREVVLNRRARTEQNKLFIDAQRSDLIQIKHSNNQLRRIESTMMVSLLKEP